MLVCCNLFSVRSLLRVLRRQPARDQYSVAVCSAYLISDLNLSVIKQLYPRQLTAEECWLESTMLKQWSWV